MTNGVTMECILENFKLFNMTGICELLVEEDKRWLSIQLEEFFFKGMNLLLLLIFKFETASKCELRR